MTPPSARTRVLLRPPATLRIPHAALEAWSGPLLVYGALSAVAVATALARGQNPIATEAWFAALASPAALPCAALASPLHLIFKQSMDLKVLQRHGAVSMHVHMQCAHHALCAQTA